jgi:hypothetical protein
MRQYNDLVALVRRALLRRNGNENEPVTITLPPAEVPASTGNNFLRNGDFDYSDDNYNNSPKVNGDQDQEAAFWFTHSAPAAGQQLKQDSTRVNEDANAATVNALLNAAHSLYGAGGGIINDPDYAKTDGLARIGSLNSLDAPLSKNFIRPSRAYILTFAARKVDSSVVIPSDLAFYAGIWVNQSGTWDWARGADLTLSVTVKGAPASTTSSDYKAILYTDWGLAYETDAVTVNRPADGSFTQDDYVEISWPSLPGILRVDIIRKTGATYLKIRSLTSGQTTVYDAGDTSAAEPATGYPATSGRKFKAFTVSRAGEFQPTTAWEEYYATIQVPYDFDLAAVAGTTWVRWGITSALATARGLELDLFNLDTAASKYSDSPEDRFAKNGPSATPSSSTQGTVGTGGDGGTVGTGGGLRCLTFEQRVTVMRWRFGRWREREIRARRLRVGDLVLNGLGSLSVVSRIEEGAAVPIYRLETENGCRIRGSASHPIIMCGADPRGTRLAWLRRGDSVYTRQRGRFSESRARSITIEDRLAPVLKITLLGTPTFIAGGVVCHNAKPTETL